MQRLRHPIRSIREPFGKAGLTVAILALVFAMAGGAWAATGLNSKQKKEVTKIAKKFAGKPGAAGAAGANGTNGTAGTNGTKGDTGAAGSNGTNGTNGKTVLNGTVDPGTGVGTTGDFYINTTTDKIFGPKPSPAGAWPAGVELKGATGSPWSAGGTLPSGSTETGAWSFKMASGTGETSLSFPIPLAGALSSTNTKTNSLAAGTGTTISGSTVITGLTHTANTPPWVGLTPITGAGIPAGTEIVEVVSPTEIEISQNATASGAGVALSSTAWSQCDDGVGTAATAEHPEADSGFFCSFAAKATGAIFVIGSLKPGGSGAVDFGASTSGVRLSAGSTTATDSVSGTFAVTG